MLIDGFALQALRIGRSWFPAMSRSKSKHTSCLGIDLGLHLFLPRMLRHNMQAMEMGGHN